MLSFVHYTDSIPTGFGAVTYGPYTRMRPKYRDDAGIHAHEQLHANQWWVWMLAGTLTALAVEPLGPFYWYYALLAGVGVHAMLYKFVHQYRLWCEVQAYKEQLKHYTEDKSLVFAKFIATKYSLNISEEEALKLLKDYNDH